MTNEQIANHVVYDSLNDAEAVKNTTAALDEKDKQISELSIYSNAMEKE